MSLIAVPTANRFTRSLSAALQPTATLANANAFDNASWTKQQSSVTPNAGTDPFAGNTAASLVEDASNNEHRVQEGIGSFHTTWPSKLALYGKAGTRSWIRIGDVNGSTGAWFNVSTGAIGTVFAGSKAYISSVGSGWYLLTLVAANLPNGTFIINMSSADNTISYAGNGTGNVLICTASVT